MSRKKKWIIGNILIGIGFVVSFLYFLFGVFWTNPDLMPWYVVTVCLIFIAFNYFAIKEHKIVKWISSLLIAIGSAGCAYLLHGLFLLLS